MKKRCKKCTRLLGEENFNARKGSVDGLAATCRACVNRRRREVDREQRQSGKPSSLTSVAAARHGRLNVLKHRDPEHPQLLLWKTIQDIHTIKKRPEHIALARHLIRKGAHPHWWMVCEAARGGNQRLVQLLLANGVEFNVFVAATIGDDAALSRLLKADVGHATAVESRIGHDAVASYHRVTPLHCCGMSALGQRNVAKNTSLVRCAARLIETGADINARADIRGLSQLTPLHCVCWSGGNTELARLLLKHGADPIGCLQFALGHFQRHGHGHYDIAELLLGAGINLQDELDDALQRASNQGDTKAVHWLLAHRANPNRKSRTGRTALHFAAERNQGHNVVKLLLEHGADLNALTSDGYTPLYLARLNGKRAVAQYLRRKGALEFR
jgi:hypothetical protein